MKYSYRLRIILNNSISSADGAQRSTHTPDQFGLGSGIPYSPNFKN